MMKKPQWITLYVIMLPMLIANGNKAEEMVCERLICDKMLDLEKRCAGPFCNGCKECFLFVNGNDSETFAVRNSSPNVAEEFWHSKLFQEVDDKDSDSKKPNLFLRSNARQSPVNLYGVVNNMQKNTETRMFQMERIEKSSNGRFCWRDGNCKSGRCSKSFRCAPKLSVGKGCGEDEDCETNICSGVIGLRTCTDGENGSSCFYGGDVCKSGRCSTSLRCEPKFTNSCEGDLIYHKHSKPLSTQEAGMVKYLAKCASDIYERDTCELSRPVDLLDNKKLIVEDCGEQGDSNILDSDFIRWGLYRLVEEDGTKTDTTILSFMGTDSFSDMIPNIRDIKQLLQDISIMVAGPIAHSVGEKASEIYEEKKPTYVTGHSLGGTIAEMVCDETGANGASFGAPGPYGIRWNLLTDKKYDGAKFSVIMNRHDNVGASTPLNCALGYTKCHVACSDQVLLLDVEVSPDNTFGHGRDMYVDEIWNKHRDW